MFYEQYCFVIERIYIKYNFMQDVQQQFFYVCQRYIFARK